MIEADTAVEGFSETQAWRANIARALGSEVSREYLDGRELRL